MNGFPRSALLSLFPECRCTSKCDVGVQISYVRAAAHRWKPLAYSTCSTRRISPSPIVLFILFYFRISFPPLASHLMPENVANQVLCQSAPGLVGRQRLTTSSIPSRALPPGPARPVPASAQLTYLHQNDYRHLEKSDMCECVRHLPHLYDPRSQATSPTFGRWIFPLPHQRFINCGR